MTPRFSAIAASGPSSRIAASNGARPGPRRQRPLPRRLRVGGHRPVGGEGAEVVDRARRRRARTSGGTVPSTSANPSRRCARPVVERIAPELAVRGEEVGRDACDLALLEQVRMRQVVGAPRGDVDREVAYEPDSLRGRIRAQGPHSRSKRTWSSSASSPANHSQSSAQAPLRSRNASRSALRHPRARLREQAAPGGERRGGAVRRAVLVRRAERQDLPERLARRRRASRRSGRPRGRLSRSATRSGAAGRRRIVEACV